MNKLVLVVLVAMVVGCSKEAKVTKDPEPAVKTFDAEYLADRMREKRSLFDYIPVTDRSVRIRGILARKSDGGVTWCLGTEKSYVTVYPPTLIKDVPVGSAVLVECNVWETGSAYDKYAASRIISFSGCTSVKVL